MNDPAPFASPIGAIAWAYAWESGDHRTAGAIERRIALMARDRYARRPGRSEGLTPLDRAAQAGMVLSRVNGLGPRTRMLLEARFSKDPRRRARALGSLSLVLRKLSHTTAPLDFIVATVRHHYGDDCPIELPDSATDRHRATLFRWRARIRRAIKRMDDQAMARAHNAMIAAGLAEGVEVPAVDECDFFT